MKVSCCWGTASTAFHPACVRHSSSCLTPTYFHTATPILQCSTCAWRILGAGARLWAVGCSLPSLRGGVALQLPSGLHAARGRMQQAACWQLSARRGWNRHQTNVCLQRCLSPTHSPSPPTPLLSPAAFPSRYSGGVFDTACTGTKLNHGGWCDMPMPKKGEDSQLQMAPGFLDNKCNYSALQADGQSVLACEENV